MVRVSDCMSHLCSLMVDSTDTLFVRQGLQPDRPSACRKRRDKNGGITGEHWAIGLLRGAKRTKRADR